MTDSKSDKHEINGDISKYYKKERQSGSLFSGNNMYVPSSVAKENQLRGRSYILNYLKIC